MTGLFITERRGLKLVNCKENKDLELNKIQDLQTTSGSPDSVRRSFKESFPRIVVQPRRSHLSHGHGTVALVVSELGLLIGRDDQRGVVQLGARGPDGLAENLLEPLVDVQHGLTAVSHLLLQALRTDSSFINITMRRRRRREIHREASMKSNRSKLVFILKNVAAVRFKKSCFINYTFKLQDCVKMPEYCKLSCSFI